MARKTSKRKAQAPRRKFQPQDLLLAGIGAVSLGKKQCQEAYANGFDGVAQLRDRTQEAVLAAVSSINQQVQHLGQQAQARLAPVLARFGIAKPVRRAPARRKPRAGSRKAA